MFKCAEQSCSQKVKKKYIKRKKNRKKYQKDENGVKNFRKISKSL